MQAASMAPGGEQAPLRPPSVDFRAAFQALSLTDQLEVMTGIAHSFGASAVALTGQLTEIAARAAEIAALAKGADR
jgi:predicted alpha/beta hydrolase